MKVKALRLMRLVNVGIDVDVAIVALTLFETDDVDLSAVVHLVVGLVVVLTICLVVCFCIYARLFGCMLGCMLLG